MLKKVMLVILVALPLLLPGPNLWADDDAIRDVDDNAAVFTGTWPTSTFRILYYGDDYQYAAGSGSSTWTHKAVWATKETADITGTYHVYVRWTAGTARATNARYEIFDDVTYVGDCTVDQRYNGGAWQFCREVELTRGRLQYVRLTNANVPTNRYVCADAVRFVRVSKNKTDIVDEPGIDYDTDTGFVNISSTSSTSPTLLQGPITITCPASGYIEARGSGGYSVLRANGPSTTAVSWVRYSVSLSTAVDFNAETIHGQKNGVASTLNQIIGYSPIYVNRVDTCSAGQSRTYRFVAYRGTAGSSAIEDPKLVVNYYTTRY